MRLYFLRHGIAEDRAPSLEDGDRRLTDEGHAEMARVAQGIRSLDLGLGAVFTSPLVRAEQTARHVVQALEPSPPLTIARELSCGCELSDIARLLADLPPSTRVLLVGHEPDLSYMVGALTGGSAVRMKKASLACVEATPGRPGSGELRWLLEAEHLSRMAGGE